MTEWSEFRSLDLARVRALMRPPILIDSRNILDPAAAGELGFTYISTGRQTVVRAAAEREPVPVLVS